MDFKNTLISLKEMAKNKKFKYFNWTWNNIKKKYFYWKSNMNIYNLLIIFNFPKFKINIIQE